MCSTTLSFDACKPAWLALSHQVVGGLSPRRLHVIHHGGVRPVRAHAILQLRVVDHAHLVHLRRIPPPLVLLMLSAHTLASALTRALLSSILDPRLRRMPCALRHWFRLACGT